MNSLTEKEVSDFFDLREKLRDRAYHVGKLMEIIFAPEHSITFTKEKFEIAGRSVQLDYLWTPDNEILEDVQEKKDKHARDIHNRKIENAIEGYKENLELLEINRKELMELGVDPTTINV